MRQPLCAALLLVAVPASADEVFLKSGGRLSGILIEQTATRLVLQTGPGTVTLPRASVERVVQKQSVLQTHGQRAALLHPTDTNGWLDLALWAKDQGLETQAREAFSRVLALDPGNAMAQAGIGKIWLNNRWLSEEDAQRARGNVLFEGSWVTPEEREDRIRERSERRAEERSRRESDARVAEAEARARAADAEARRAEADSMGGIPYGWVAGGGYYVNGYGNGYGNGRYPGQHPRTASGNRPGSAAHPHSPAPLPPIRDTGRSGRGEAPPRKN